MSADGPPSVRRARAGVGGLLVAQALSGTGDMLAAIALPWFVLQETGSPALTALTGFASLLPLVVAGLLGGAIVDRFGFRDVSVVADLASGATVALIPILALTGALEIWHVMVLAFLGSILDIPGATGRQSALPALAQRAELRLDRLNAAAEAIRRGTHLIGPPLAGVLIALIGPTAVLWIDVASFAISAALVAGLVPAIRASVEAESAASWIGRVREGLAFLFGDRLLRAVVVLIGLLNVVMNPVFFVVLPVYADATTGRAIDLGLLIGAFGVGSVIAAVAYGALATRLSRPQLLRGALVFTALPVWLLSLLPPVPVALPAMLVIGLAVGGVGPMILTVLGERTPPALRGRVFGTYATLVNGSIPFGVILVGVLLESVPIGLAVAGIALVVSLLAVSAIAHGALDELAPPGPESVQPRPGAPSVADEPSV